jgi:hypothetical protein
MYAGGRDAFGVGGPPGLLERGEENVRIGRGRTGTMSVVELDEEDEDMTEALRLRSAREGLWTGSSVEGGGCSRVIMAVFETEWLKGTDNEIGNGWEGNKGNEIGDSTRSGRPLSDTQVTCHKSRG